MAVTTSYLRGSADASFQSDGESQLSDLLGNEISGTKTPVRPESYIGLLLRVEDIAQSWRFVDFHVFYSAFAAVGFHFG